MSRTSRNLVLIVVLLGLGAALGGGAWWLARSGEPLAVELAPVRDASTPAPEATPARRTELAAELPPTAQEAGPTTVVWPLEVELELLEGRPPVPLPDDGLAPGVAGTARLRGHVWNETNEGAAAEIVFEFGPNAGRVLACDASGAFGADDLLPGISIVRVEGAGLVGAQRELLLRQERETRFDLSFARPGSVLGSVVDSDGAPIANALVTLDGHEGRTDETGSFRFPTVAGGEALLVIEHPGYRALRETLGVTAGSAVPAERARWVLRAGASLEVHVPERIGGEGEALLFLLPPAGTPRDFPWHLVNPVRVWPGGSARVDGLPEGRLDLRLFHGGARSEPEVGVVNLSPGKTTATELHLVPAPMLVGTVKQADAPVARARVTLEPADTLAATLAALRVDYAFVESEVLPLLPPARQVAFSDAKGEVAFTAYPGAQGTRWVFAYGPDGRSAAAAALPAEAERFELVLVPADELDPRAKLRLRLPGRFQALPVELRVAGTPRDPLLLPADRDLVVDRLVPGRWALSARWDVETLASGRELVIEDELTLELELPEGAIQGQPPEVRARAGPR